MPNSISDTEAPTRLALPAILDLKAAPSLKQDLMLAAAGVIEVDAGDVQRVSSLCLQLLLAARQQTGLRISSSSDVFNETALGLGLSQALGLTQPAMAGDSDG